MSNVESPTYVHRPLRSATYIRIVVLQLDADPEAELRCSIREIPIADVTAETRYMALSYTWGKPEFTQRLWCDGKVFWITVNLNQALRRLREFAAVARIRREVTTFAPEFAGMLLELANDACTVAIWADAVCIDQQDEIEKSQQVRIMPQIYRAACHVVSWFGMDAESTFAPAFFSYLADTSVQDYVPNVSLHDDNGLRPFLNVLYWTRRWVIQETVYATSLTFLHGTSAISADLLDHGLINLLYPTIRDGSLRPKVGQISRLLRIGRPMSSVGLPEPVSYTHLTLPTKRIV